ncbi:MAG: glutamyl-tRNA reductase [Deltaproteobacteria bacterium]|nr:glutamyl-tRNA reductase [Deltaproteobacteria bacterium]
MNIIVVGLNYRTAPLAIRERLAFIPSRTPEALAQLMERPAVRECLLLSTCNRVEIYAVTPQVEEGVDEIREFLAAFHGLGEEVVRPHLYTWCGAAAVRHLFRVAAGLDSMVIGEPQILGQVKAAYSQACRAKTNALIVNRLLHRAFSVAKRVRSETGIAGKAVSIPFAAVEMVRRIFGTLAGKSVLLIGSGKIGELAARHFLGHGVASIAVINRTLEKAQEVAERFHGTAFPFEELSRRLTAADIVLSCTAAPHYILRPLDVERILPHRQGRPLFLVDIAVPRDIDPQVGSIPQVYLYDVDDLQGIISSNMVSRRKEAEKGERIIEAEVARFQRWLADLDVVPTILALRRRVETVCEAEKEKALGALGEAAGRERAAVEAMAAAIAGKLLHYPIVALKSSRTRRMGNYYVDALRYLFDLTPDEGDAAGEKMNGEWDCQEGPAVGEE